MKHGHKKHHGAATKSVKHGMHGKGKGSNLSLPTPSQAMHVVQKKDNMAGNVGGSAHMQASAKSLGHQEIIESSGKGKPRHVHEKF